MMLIHKLERLGFKRKMDGGMYKLMYHGNKYIFGVNLIHMVPRWDFYEIQKEVVRPTLTCKLKYGTDIAYSEIERLLPEHIREELIYYMDELTNGQEIPIEIYSLENK